ncbi:MAG: oligoendopeptidase F, partial [Litorivivens sp.]
MTTRSTPIRTFLPANLEISSWEILETWLIDLQDRELNNLESLEKWLLDLSEMEAFIEEDAAWRYIRMTINTKDEKLTESYQWFVSEIQPKISPFSNAFNLKLAESPFAESLTGRAYQIYLRQIQKEIELFREENIVLQSEIAQFSQEYGARIGAMEVEMDGETMTMPKAASELQKTDRSRRQLVWEAIQSVRNEAIEELDELFTKLRDKRHQVATNSAFTNFRDYKFEEMGRFDYSKEDCFDFHDSIARQIKPIVTEFLNARCTDLGLDKLRPWDLAVDPKQNSPLKPFGTANELLEKSVAVFSKVDPYFGECLSTMNEMGYLDLASKEGKA